MLFRKNLEMSTEIGSLLSPDDKELHRKTVEHRIYHHRVKGVTILICSLIFLGGLWISGLDLEDLVWRAGMFNPKEHVCLKTVWVSTTQGTADRVQLCTEWIDLSDLSGQTHRMAIENLEVLKGQDGKIHTHLQRGINYRLVMVVGFLTLIILAGRIAQHFLITRHKQRMGLTS